MSLLDHGQPADVADKKHHSGLIALVAILAVALVAAGTWLFVDYQQQSTEAQQAEIIDVITAQNRAVNAHDGDALEATLTDDFIWSDNPGLVDGIGATEYVGLWTNWGGISETFTADPVFSGESQVVIPTHREAHAVVPPWAHDGTYTFTLREVDGQWKIATMVFTLTKP